MKIILYLTTNDKGECEWIWCVTWKKMTNIYKQTLKLTWTIFSASLAALLAIKSIFSESNTASLVYRTSLYNSLFCSLHWANNSSLPSRAFPPPPPPAAAAAADDVVPPFPMTISWCNSRCFLRNIRRSASVCPLCCINPTFFFFLCFLLRDEERLSSSSSTSTSISSDPFSIFSLTSSSSSSSGEWLRFLPAIVNYCLMWTSNENEKQCGQRSPLKAP